jgi:beta-glucosidase
MMPWKDRVNAILWMFYPGVNGATAAAEIIAGKVNPSGKLPMSMEKKLEDNSANDNFSIKWHDNGPAKFAGTREYWDVHYEEGIFVGYRHLDTQNIEPLFPFGHGLSYTTFDYSNMKVKTVSDTHVQVSCEVKNIGAVSGKEVVQLYVTDPESSHPRPLKELKAFEKIHLYAGETKTVSLLLDKSSFSYWSPDKKDWYLEPGQFKIILGSSSRDLRLSEAVYISSLK